MVGTPGHDAVFNICDIVTSQDQPANMVELVLGSVCQLRRQSTRRCGRIPAVEFFDRSSLRIADFDRWQLEPEYFLTSLVGRRGLPPLSRPSSTTCCARQFTLRCSAHTFRECLQPANPAVRRKTSFVPVSYHFCGAHKCRVNNQSTCSTSPHDKPESESEGEIFIWANTTAPSPTSNTTWFLRSDNVANIENSIMARRPDHSAPLP